MASVAADFPTSNCFCSLIVSQAGKHPPHAHYLRGQLLGWLGEVPRAHDNGAGCGPDFTAPTRTLQTAPHPSNCLGREQGGHVTSEGHGGPSQEGVLRPRPSRGSTAALARPFFALGALQRTACFPSEPFVIQPDGGETEAPGSQRGGLKSQTGSQGPRHRGLSAWRWLHQLANPDGPRTPGTLCGCPRLKEHRPLQGQPPVCAAPVTAPSPLGVRMRPKSPAHLPPARTHTRPHTRHAHGRTAGHVCSLGPRIVPRTPSHRPPAVCQPRPQVLGTGWGEAGGCPPSEKITSNSRCVKGNLVKLGCFILKVRVEIWGANSKS